LAEKLGLAKLNHQTTVAHWLHIVKAELLASPAQRFAITGSAPMIAD
jgi:hypothetical protein